SHEVTRTSLEICTTKIPNKNVFRSPQSAVLHPSKAIPIREQNSSPLNSREPFNLSPKQKQTKVGPFQEASPRVQIREVASSVVQKQKARGPVSGEHPRLTFKHAAQHSSSSLFHRFP